MKTFCLYLIYIASLVSLVACHDHLPLPDESEETDSLEQVVIVYIMAENSLSYDAKYVQSDLNEMSRGYNQIPEGCKLVVYKDNTLKPVIYTLDNQKAEFNTWKEYKDDLNSTDSTQFATTLSLITSNFPAKRYGLVMWSHGTGWIPAQKRTIGIDNNRNNSTLDVGTELEISAMRGALEGIRLHPDYILWDACFMQCIEVAYELRDVTDWNIGSAAEIPGYGAPYDQIMTALFNSDIQSIVKEYHNYYTDKGGVNLSAIRSDELDELAYQTSRYSALIYQNNAETAGIQSYGPYCQQSDWRPEYYDIGSAAYNLLPVDLYSEYSKALNKAIPYRESSDRWASRFTGIYSPTLTDPLHFVGVSTFLPNEKYYTRGYNEAFHRTSWWKAVKP